MRLAKTRISSSRCLSSCSKYVITFCQTESASISTSQASTVRSRKTTEDGEAGIEIQCRAFGAPMGSGRGPLPRECFAPIMLKDNTRLKAPLRPHRRAERSTLNFNARFAILGRFSRPNGRGLGGGNRSTLGLAERDDVLRA